MLYKVSRYKTFVWEINKKSRDILSTEIEPEQNSIRLQKGEGMNWLKFSNFMIKWVVSVGKVMWLWNECLISRFGKGLEMNEISQSRQRVIIIMPSWPSRSSALEKEWQRQQQQVGNHRWKLIYLCEIGFVRVNKVLFFNLAIQGRGLGRYGVTLAMERGEDTVGWERALR